ncbi:alpha/beta hydrolase [Stakelama sediminis]|uniref:Palmitoyl-protein thioesterase ABHD10, mitochondrial n=1 Tax=Stakelama sediminis TaxID=463200 RepID=A0A840YZP1_9SPHN|nr:alpha/beta hydrolase [Stakelama sediminis]MBB5719009.1 pimeloyl-ACP methyl ester carboxylesterase [Stakelama sediminis]
MTDTPLPLAHHRTDGKGPTILFLPGYASDMAGTKAVAIEQWAQQQGRGFVRFDYRGCGESPGAFEEFTLADWRDDVLRVIDDLTSGPVVLVGSSMGGWLMLLAALARRDRVAGLVGIAPAPDFTDWGFTAEQKGVLLNTGRLEEESPYSDEPTVTTRAFWASGEANRLMFGPIAFAGPVRILQGMQDGEVPWIRATRLAELLQSDDVRTTLVKGGDHRLSRPQDIDLILREIDDICTTLG